jgi:hypothetical protein
MSDSYSPETMKALDEGTRVLSDVDRKRTDVAKAVAEQIKAGEQEFLQPAWGALQYRRQSEMLRRNAFEAEDKRVGRVLKAERETEDARRIAEDNEDAALKAALQNCLHRLTHA